ncbi:ferrous iron transport protein B [Mariniphaga anaerophila]|uniref:Ferrous iron transport protein B n=1 Tax=Mariniphaga anaerophila TaxID=1484053 RepID=A0A1M5FFS8_9BACT|nr:ferrous iron transport protein B [Mariniphaga anaerophila]SHF90427.1 ferrous iron transport protein B [Mariniphaga anaerophila]
MAKTLHVALIGNPNTGKTSVFNQLTGLNQKVGNYPGITVEKKTGTCKLSDEIKARITDLPGTYSLNATSADEQIVVEALLDENPEASPDVAVIVADVESLKRNLFLFTQIKELDTPVILAINMADNMEKKGISLDVKLLEKQLNTRVALISARKGTGIDSLKKLILEYQNLPKNPVVNISEVDPEYFKKLEQAFPGKNRYKQWLRITQNFSFTNRKVNPSENLDKTLRKDKTELKRMQQKEAILRYLFINKTLKETYRQDVNAAKDLRSRLDQILTHRIFGYVLFFLIILLVFQSIYSWSSYPMDLIDSLFASMSQWVKNTLPDGALTDLVSEGIIPGIGGIVIFIPQIAFLFFFISILEESGYMSRVVFIMDRLMRRFGLNGKSVVPLISGTACAIPAVMATRTIENWKERLITILVTPFITCSARLPVYLIIIALVIPDQTFFGFNLQGLTLMGLYLLGFLAAVISAYILNKILKIKNRSFFIAEMPDYKLPLAKNIGLTVYDKTRDFVVGAGKIILAISIVLWFLASHGYSEQFHNAKEIVLAQPDSNQLDEEALETAIASYRLQHSYIGILGHTIEPAIRPLGYDWKIGVALITSFAAREVFVGSLATIYSVGTDDEETIKNRLAGETNITTGKKTFNLPTGISLLLFYAFAMQCMSTLAVVKRETNSWKWPAIQLFFMSGFAYIVSLLAYQFLK